MMEYIPSKSDFLHEFDSFSNLTIICSDGLLFSHKVVLASISSYVKQLLSQFPLGDEVTLYLPDYTRVRVESFVTSKVFEETQYEEDLARHFKAVKPLNGFQQCDKEVKTEVEEHFEDLEENEEQVPNVVKEKSEKQQMQKDVSELTKEKNGNGQDMNGFLKCEVQTKKEVEENFEDLEENEGQVPDGVQKKIENQQIHEDVSEFTNEKNVDTQDKTPAQISELRVMKKRIAYEKAIKEFESGQATSYRQAAVKFGVSDVTLRRKIIKQGKEFTGKGRVNPLTSEEQNALKDTILLATNNGNDLTVKQIRDFIAKEASNIVRKYPERSVALSKCINPSISNAYYFARKHGLDKIMKENDRNKKILERRIYKCDICASSFTFKNSMISHKRDVHLYFLKNNKQKYSRKKKI